MSDNNIKEFCKMFKDVKSKDGVTTNSGIESTVQVLGELLDIHLKLVKTRLMTDFLLLAFGDFKEFKRIYEFREKQKKEEFLKYDELENPANMSDEDMDILLANLRDNTMEH